MRLSDLPFRIGTTSYIIPDEILPNVRYLADKVRDVQLVLFELDSEHSNLPSADDVDELNRLAKLHDLTYTVHLPLDLRLAARGDEAHISQVKARRVIEVTRDLSPRAYIVHMDGKEERSSNSAEVLANWQEQAIKSLQIVAEITGDIRLLAVENLEGYPPAFNDGVISRSGSSRCIDIGHLWLDGHDALEFFTGRIEQTNVMHLHGIGERDHQSLALMPKSRIDDLFRYLLKSGFTGVLTLEVFSEADLATSLQAIDESLKRIDA